MQKRFRSQSWLILILGFFIMYFYSGLNVDQMNALTPYYTTTFGWQASQIMAPVTVASLISIPLGFIVGSLLIKFDIQKPLSISCFALGLSTILLGFAGDNFKLYWIALLLVRSLPVALSMSVAMLCTNWFVKKRGWALGIVTAGCPLCSATLITLLTFGIRTLGFSTTYTIMGCILIVLGVITLVAAKSSPEELDLFPDGADSLPAREQEVTQISIKDVMKNADTWLLTIGFGFLSFCIVGVMAFYVVNMAMSGTAEPTYLLWLAIGSILGIPLSYLLGLLDDKVGTVKCCFVLCLFYLVVLIGMIVIKKDQVALIALIAFGIAGMTGGTPNLHPSLTVYCFGRKNFQAANRWVNSFLSILVSFAASFMALILDSTGSLKLGYLIMIGMVIVAAICFAVIGRKPDFDRSAN